MAEQLDSIEGKLISIDSDASSPSMVEDKAITEKTVVVLGVPRGGTTMVAGIVQRCGISLGNDLPTNLEDQAFVGVPIEDMVLSIAERNRTKSVWGWKYPRAAIYLPIIQEYLINPHYIIVWRDVFASSSRRRHSGESIHDALHWAHKIQEQNIEVTRNLSGPQLMISYEKAILDPVEAANQICDFLDIEKSFSEAAVRGFATPGSYKTNPDTDIRHVEDRALFSFRDNEYVFHITNKNDVVQKQHYLGKLYKQHELELLGQYVSDGQTIVDVGANIGNHTIFFAKSFPHSTVIPIEPSPAAIKILEANITASDCANIDTRFLGEGVSSSAGPALLQRGSANNLGNARITREMRYADLNEQDRNWFQEIRLSKGDDLLCATNVGFIKIDVAGHELEVLRGLGKTIQRCRPTISVTIEDHDLESFHRWMMEASYYEVSNVSTFASCKTYIIQPDL